jgi:phospholipase/lecithinase/hemolysin
MKHFLAAMAVSIALPASADTVGPFSDLVMFGDSLSDSGNVAILADALGGGFNYADYPLGQFTNGNTWATLLGLTPSVLGGSNFAYGGARAIENGDAIPDLDAQISQFANSGITLGDNPLAAIWIGGNDFRDFAASGPISLEAATVFVGSLIAEISDAVVAISQTGINEIIVFGLPDLGRLPDLVGTAMGAAVTELVGSYNSFLSGTVVSLNAWLAGVTVSFFDVDSLFQEVLGDGGQFGFTNTTQACLSVPAACEGNEAAFVFWDSIHPTEAVHQIIAGTFAENVSQVPLPAGFPLLLGSLAAFAVVSRRRKSHA